MQLWALPPNPLCQSAVLALEVLEGLEDEDLVHGHVLIRPVQVIPTRTWHDGHANAGFGVRIVVPALVAIMSQS